MKNKPVFEKQLDDSTKIRQEINNVHNKEMNQYARLFKKLFNRKNTFKFVKDLCYYTGGWPTDETPAKLESLTSKFAKAAYYFEYMDRDEFKEYCLKYGIEVKLLNPINDVVGHDEQIKNINQLDAEWYDIFHEQRPQNKKECLDVLIETASGLQSVICDCADEIKIRNAGKVEEECQVKKGHFVKAVNINASPNKQKQIEKIKKNSKEISEVVEEI